MFNVYWDSNYQPSSYASRADPGYSEGGAGVSRLVKGSPPYATYAAVLYNIYKN